MILFARLILTYKFESVNMTSNDLPKWDGSGNYNKVLFDTKIKLTKHSA